MSDETQPKPERSAPVLQPMRIVQVPEAPITAVSTDTTTSNAVSEFNPTGKQLVRSKKDIENAKKSKLPKPPNNLPLLPPEVIEANNLARIDGLDRNAKIDRSGEELFEFDEDWLANQKGIAIKVAWMQTAISVSGFINSESTFSQQKLKGLTMSWTAEGLLCKIVNQHGERLLLIPAANVKAMLVR